MIEIKYLTINSFKLKFNCKLNVKIYAIMFKIYGHQKFLHIAIVWNVKVLKIQAYKIGESWKELDDN